MSCPTISVLRKSAAAQRTARHFLSIVGAFAVMLAASYAAAMIGFGGDLARVALGIAVTAPAFTAAYLAVHTAPSLLAAARRVGFVSIALAAAGVAAAHARGLL